MGVADDIPTWAIEKALKPFLDDTPTAQWTAEAVLAEMDRPRGAIGFAALVLAYARLIAEHEEPPVDPLLVEARQIAADTGMTLWRRDEIVAGRADLGIVQPILTALRRGIERGKQP